MYPLKNFVESLLKSDLANESDLQGCSEAEIDELERSEGCKLPQRYRDFLGLMGHNAGKFNQGSSFLYHRVFGLTKYAKETMASGPFQLPENTFVFFSHQGYIFAYFKLSEGDNPPVFTYMEGEQAPILWGNSFTEYLEKALDEEIETRKHVKHLRGMD